MFRDFSQEAKEKLISYVNDTSSDGIWQIIKNSIDYMDVKIKNWLHTLDSYAYLSQMDGYYQTVLNKHDTTRSSLSYTKFPVVIFTGSPQ